MSETCNAKTEIYSRITGYFRPVDNWNIAKQQEFKDRKLFTGIESEMMVALPGMEEA